MCTLELFERPRLRDWRTTHMLCRTLRGLQVDHRYVKHRAFRHDHGALNDVLEFPDIARPIVEFQNSHYFLGDALDRLALSLCEALHEMFD
jgi:hypothetical protein